MKPSPKLIAEHAEIRTALAHLRASLSDLAEGGVKEQRRSMDHVIRWLEEHIETHTKFEDTEVYPSIERYVRGNALTAALRVEHRVIRRNFDQLRRLAAEPVPSALAFTCLVDNLIGLFLAHFEVEETVLFPVLDEMAAQKTGVAVDSPTSRS